MINKLEYEYNEELGYETISDEYKLFTFNPIIIDPDDCLDSLKTKKWIFNESTIQSIKTYFKLYLPKYISAYTHPLTKITHGNLFIGVDDDGVIYGVPFQGDFPINIIKEEINNIFDTMIRIKEYHPSNTSTLINIFEHPDNYNEINYPHVIDESNIKIIKKYKESIQVKIFNIKKNKIVNNISTYENYTKKLNELETDYIKFLNKKQIWKKLIIEHTNKLHEMLNDLDIRRDIITFIKEKSNYQKKYFKNKYSDLYYLCDVPNYYDLVGELNSGFKYSSMKNKSSDEYRNNPTNIFYWVTRWKDSKTSILKYIKPKSQKNNTNKNYPMFLLSQVHQMIPEWINSNPDLKLYLIKIKIPGNLDKLKVIEYYDGINWIENYRKINLDGPTSIPICSFI
jgi:hypothetical protein